MFSISVSPCSLPEHSLPDVLRVFCEAGYEHVEVFTSWVNSAFDFDAHSPDHYLSTLREYELSVSSLHLPPFAPGQVDSVLPRTVRACEFAADLGAPVVIAKAGSRGLEARAAYAEGYRRLLDEVDTNRVRPVLTNHFGTCVETLEHYREVIERIADPRCRTVLEVGHFHSAGIPWPEAYEALAGSFSLVHIKDQIGPRSVPFGAGDIDLTGLLQRLLADGYTGAVVVEMENEDRENTPRYLADAREYILNAIAGEM